MKKIIMLPILAGVLMFTSFTTSFAQSVNFKNGKALEIQTNILRTLQSQYVDTLELDKLIMKGVNSMLSTLDPYTVLILDEDEQQIDMMTTGSYGGVGSMIKKLPTGEVLVSGPYENSPAVKAGLQPGDKILEIDGVSTQQLDATQSSTKMRGQPGTELKLKVKKVRTGDTVNITVLRERVHINDVVYYGMIKDTVGYIQIGGFTLDGYKDVKKALESLKESGKMKKLVLDLRGNGGGLMDEAINIVSLFVPSGTLVVSSRDSRGEDKTINIEYRTKKEPLDTQIPLVVLVNSGSASSSEIVAGALQDLDRATIAGTRTFGKGLVQTIRDVGYNNSLKLTTAKYYTPSGRCVQAIDYQHRNEDGSVGFVPDSLKKEFKTVGGRSVYDGGGISPDITLESKYYNNALVSLIYSDIMGDFAIKYFENHPTIAPPSRFSISDADYEEFVKFAVTREFDPSSELQVELQNVIEVAKKEGTYEKNAKELEALLAKVSMDKEKYLRSAKEDVKQYLESEICGKYYFQRGSAEYALRFDTQLIKLL